MKKKDEEWAIFWCSLLEPVLFGEIPRKKVQGFLKKLATKERLFPDGTRRKPTIATLRRKLRTYQKEGFESLARKIRSDRGKPRAHQEKIIKRAVELKRDQPLRSHVTINKFLEFEEKTKIPRSTLYRHLDAAGATRIKLGVSKKKVRRRWSRDHTHDLWVGDFENGPYVLYEGQVVQTQLSAFIDCHSRFLVEGRYYYHQNLDILIDSLLRAWATHGLPRELYVDHGKVYQANALKAACYALPIKLIYRGKGDPPPGGLIEKFFETAQGQFEAEVRAGEILILDQLNRAFSAWLDLSYHKEIHSETRQSPKDRYQSGLKIIRPVDMEKALLYFMRREERTVHPDFSDVQLLGRFYRVEKRLRKDRVEVRYDPFGTLDTVLIYSLRGEYLGKGILHHREKGEDSCPQPQAKPKYNYLDLLIQEHERELRKRAQGIDYQKVLSQKGWPFSAFAKSLAQLLGRKGELSSFSTEELECLQKVYNRNPWITEMSLLEAFEKAQEKTILYVVREIQNIADRKDR